MNNSARRSSRRSRCKTLRALESDAQQQAVSSSTPRGSRRSSRASSPAVKPSCVSSSSSSPVSSSSKGCNKKKKKKKRARGGGLSSKGVKSVSSASSLRGVSTGGSSGRGYNPELVNYKDSEYHYGSDFEDEEEDLDLEGDLEEDDPESKGDSEDSEFLSSLSSNEECDVDISPEDDTLFLPPESVPFWLSEDKVPAIHLPESSGDLPLDNDVILDALAVYEALIHYRLLLRLSPFRLEDFAWCLSSEEQSNLLSEVHVALLKALLRADEKEGSTYGPLDQKDSFHCMFYFVDSITWPENLRAFLSSNDVAPFKEALELLRDNEYPFGKDFLQRRVRVLTLLVHQFLSTSAVREYIASEGTPAMEDHCRVCHRLGDMVVCDICGGTYHLPCLDPPLSDVPDEEEWTCQICKDNTITGVTDGFTKGEETARIRNEALGLDRAGNKYWFLCRRIFIEHNIPPERTLQEDEEEEEEDGSKKEDVNNPPKPVQVSYFSYLSQFQEMMHSLDPNLYEAELCEAIESKRSEIERQMQVTERLTREFKDNGSRSTYLELENEAMRKIQIRREEIEKKRSEELLKASQGNDGEDNKSDQGDSKMELDQKDESNVENDEKEKDSAQQEEKDDIKEEIDVEDSKAAENLNGDENIEVKDEEKAEVETGKETQDDEASNKDMREPSTSVTSSRDELEEELAGELRMTRQTLLQLNSGTLYYKLGQEGNFRNYVNQYTTNPLALSKVQANEERDKKRFMSHKFSLTDASAFKWQGNIFGSRKFLINTVRQSLIHLENSIPSMFMHANWSILRKPWIGAVNQSVTSRDFSRALTVLQCCMRPCVMLSVWRDQLGHISLKRITSGMREEKKKLEKREKRESDERDERLKPFMSFVKYTLGVKHQIVKQKGEEYRSHGQHGWLWFSATRYFKPTDSRHLGLKGGPHRLAVKYTDTRDDTSKVVLMEPRGFEYLLKRQTEIDLKKKRANNEDEDESHKESSENSKIAIDTKKLEEALKNARLDRQVPPEDSLKDVVDVEHGLSNPTRVLFPKVAKKAQYIDDFLARRLQLKTIEEQCLSENKDNADESGEDSVHESFKNTKSEGQIAQIKKDIWVIINKLKENAKNCFQKPQCYSPTCRNYKAFALSQSPCYSSSCPSRKSPLKEARAFYLSIILKDSSEMGVSIPQVLFNQSFASHNLALQALMNLLKSLMQKPLSGNSSPIVNGDKSEGSREGNNENSSDLKTDTSDRIYSSRDTTKKIYLKRVKNSSSDKKSSKIVKYPLAPHFFSKSRKTRNILILSRHDAKHLARKAGTTNAEGFNYSAKVNNAFWPYPCPRPTFRTAWLYRTASLSSIHAIALQMRILWGCIRWDDMFAKPLTAEGKHQVTTDTSVVTTEILNQRCTGRFLERNEFLVKKITIPLDTPKTVVEVTPIRSGLRKRKRAESPQQSEPKIEEEWMDESALELWEIRAFREKLEKERVATVTRSRTGTAIREPVKYDPGLSSDYSRRERGLKNNENEQPNLNTSSPGGDILSKAVGNINNNRAGDILQGKKLLGSSQVNTRPCTPTIIRRVTNPDGTISLVKSTPTLKSMDSSPVTTPNTPSLSRTPGSSIGPQTKKVFISKDGKIIGTQVVPLGQGGKPSSPSIPGLPPKPAAATAPATPTQQKVQIVRSSDGKIQVKGLLPGQQLVQMPDGKLQIFSQPGISQPAAAPPSPLPSSATNSPSIPTPVSKGPEATTKAMEGKQQIVAQQLPPGSQIPPGMTVFMSNGKTYCIPKAATLAAQQQKQQLVNNSITTSASPSTPLKKPSSLQISPAVAKPSPTLPPASPQTHSVSPAQKTQTVSVMSLGSNSVTFRGNQMIVSGPDQAQAQLIAKHLSSGTARLGNIGGKQVLIMTPPQQENTQAQQQQQQVSNNISPILPQTPTSPTIIQPHAQETLGSVVPEKKIISPLKQDTTQPMTTEVVEAPSQVTAQLIQTPQGPRIILQGIQGANLSRDQLLSIQQQVKTQLLKAQALAKLENRVPPTKIAVVLPASIQERIDQQNKLRQEQLKRDSFTTNVKPSLEHVSSPQKALVEPTSSLGASQEQQALPHKVVQSGQSVSFQQSASGQRMLLVSQSGQKILGVSPNNASAPEEDSSPPAQGNELKEEAAEVQPPSISHEEQQHYPLNQAENIPEEGPGDFQELHKEDPPTEGLEWETSAQHNVEIESVVETEEKGGNSPVKTVINSPPLRPEPPPPRRGIDDKRRQHIQNRLSSMLFRQKEQLKKDIAKKRALQEKELQFAISREIDKAKNSLRSGVSSYKRKREEEEEESPPSSRKKKKSGGAGGPSVSSPPAAAIQAGIIKKDKVYCICKTKYDATKFYVGCDTCNNWFHGHCVGITEEMSKTMTEYFCDECKSAKDNQEIYCLCRQPYDDLQFYIGCERCADWFHGRCVGILQVEADNIDEYICPRCDSNTSYNYANLKPLNEHDNELVKKLVKQLISHRNSWPFKEPVDPNDVPNYYTVVKEPMDLQTIELRVNQSQYTRLSDFVGDVMRIFENCRYFNQDNSQVLKCAESLENYFAQKLATVREKVAPS